MPRDNLDRDDRLGLIHEIGRAVTGTLDLQALYDTIWKQVSRVMDTSLFFIALHDADVGVVHLPYLREAGKLFVDDSIPSEGTVTGLVMERGTSLLFRCLKDYTEYGFRNGLGDVSIGEHDPEAMIFVPLTTNDRTIGALSVQSFRPDAYSTEDVQTLSVIASQAAIAIENARLYARSQDNVRHMQALLHVARVINSSLDLETVLDAILAGMHDVVPYYLAAILLPDKENRALELVGVAGPLAEERRRSIRVPFGAGITGHVFTSGEALNVGDVKLFPGYIGHGLLAVRSELGVPLKRGETVVGVLDVQRTRVQSFAQSDVDALALFASQAAIAIENARLFAEQRERAVELQTLQRIVQAITPLHEPPDIAQAIGVHLQELIHYHSYRMFLFQEDDQVLVPLPLGDEPTGGLRLLPGQGIAGWVAQQGQPLIVPDAENDPRATHIPGTPRRSESILSVPMAYEGRVRGVISLSRLGKSQFDENAMRLLEIVGAQAAIALDRARLYEKLRAEAITDAVTRLYNRRYLVERFGEERSRAARSERALSALMLDIDRFKLVNDTHGHDAGDVVLQELARLVRLLVRREDVVARYGGEEFCVLVPGAPIPHVLAMAERLRRSIECHTFAPEAGVRSISVSVGVATLMPDDSAHELFSRADRAMYEVKRRGGNGVCLSAGAEDFVFASSPGETAT